MKGWIKAANYELVLEDTFLGGFLPFDSHSREGRKCRKRHKVEIPRVTADDRGALEVCTLTLEGHPQMLLRR